MIPACKCLDCGKEWKNALFAPPQCPNCQSICIESDWQDQGNLYRLREALRTSSLKTIIKFDCFNKEEAEWIEKRLTEGEKKRVKLTWLKFG